jgi:DNA-binding transcriptional regulator GbsR (MarR family)
MGQGDIVNLLEKSKKPLTAKQIQLRLKNSSLSCISRSLKRLKDFNEIKYTIKKEKTHRNYYYWK